MKKVLSFLLAFLLFVSLVACDLEYAPTDPSAHTDQHSHATDSLATESAVIETLRDTVPKVWHAHEETDQFNDPTGEKYVMSDKFTGTFSNWLTTDSKLLASLYVTPDSVYVLLWEYGNVRVTGNFFDVDYDLIIKDQSGKKYTAEGYLEEGSNAIYVCPYKGSHFETMLNQQGTIKIFMQEYDNSSTTYLFDVDTTGFSDAYQDAFGSR